MPTTIVLDTAPIPTCKLSPRDVAGLLDALATYHAQFASACARPEQAEQADRYLRGLLSDCPRKAIEPMALALGVPIRPLQYFMGQSAWATTPFLDQHQALVAHTLGEDDGVYLIDASGMRKQGNDSVGVARQYCAPHGHGDAGASFFGVGARAVAGAGASIDTQPSAAVAHQRAAETRV